MRIERDNLIKQLEMARPGLSPKEFIEQSSCFVFNETELQTYNDEIACRVPLKLGFTGAIQASKLLQFLEKANDPVFMVRENENGELEFKGKNKVSAIQKEAEIHLPVDKVERPEEEDWFPVHKDFATSITRLQHCVSRDESKAVLTCVHITPKYLEACDNIAMLRCHIKTKVSEPVLVRGTSLLNMTTLGMIEMAITPSWVHFRNKDGLVMSMRTYAEDYPDLGSILDLPSGQKVVLPQSIKEAVQRAAVFAVDIAGSPTLEIRLKPGKVAIYGTGLVGWHKEIRRIKYDGPPIRFSVSPSLFEYIADEYREAKVNGDRLKAEGSNWTYVCVLGSNTKADEAIDE